ncbi:MAG: DUF1080 domain-containing protein [Phycisphaerae bacterium]|nr:DUF1080 domain-containing protein [Phycisphaerae bacterium]
MRRILPSRRSPALVVALLSVAGVSCSPDAPPPTTVAAQAIFNGRDLTGWDGDPNHWRVEDECLVGETTAERPIAHNTFVIYRGADVADFELTCDYMIESDWANSGIQYRSSQPPDAPDAWVVGGYQADIDEPVTYTGILYGERDRGILAERGQRVTIEKGGAPRVTGSLGDRAELAKAIHGKGAWNSYRIVVTGNRAVHEINGVKMAEIVDDDVVVTEPGAKGARARGILALQLHTGAPMKIRFRNLMLRPIAAEKTGA